MRPYVTLKAAQSLDGYLDDTLPERLILSSPEDRERVDHLRAQQDAILIGANTMRVDNPRLIINSEQLRQERVDAGRPAHLLKVTMTRSGNVDPDLKWFHHGDKKIVYTTGETGPELSARLDGLAEVVALEPEVSLRAMLDDLGDRGIGRLLVEGGERVHTQFLAEQLADEIQLVIAPLLVGGGPRFISQMEFP